MTTPYASEQFLHQLLTKALAANASDIHVKVGQPPGARVRGDMVYFRVDKVKPEDTDALAKLLLAHRGIEDVSELREFDTSYSVPSLGRFRVNVYRQRGSLAVVLRSIPLKIPQFDELGLPAPVRALAELDRGLVLVVGAAGNGKSTTLASMIGYINQNLPKHIVTIEDPIEFLHVDSRSGVSQREVGIDTDNFARALRASLRQDPDVILVGETRDEETLEITMQAAETGHLVLTTMHTPDVSRTVNRMMSLTKNPGELRERLGDALQGIIAQRLVPKRDGTGMCLVAEILVASGTAREAIKRPEQNPSLREVMEKGVVPYGMQTFDMHLKQLAAQGIVSKDLVKKDGGF
ncbi:MAG TPA: PilT/PilU family type 4a pilus ATPase [Polyangiaceae bacterium]|nr:PilT/PilU family type 4a pilus ATPase [Polyangiaceae bacterium]